MLESGIIQASKEEVLAFARKYDPRYFHADEEAARDVSRQTPGALGTDAGGRHLSL
jgi:acyl dehydratase